MQLCPIHNIPLTPLFSTLECPICTNGTVLEISFEDLPPNEKRVAIAKDVLERLNTGKIVPSVGSFVHFAGEEDLYERCGACALGALVICHLQRNGKNSFNLSQLMAFGSSGSNRTKVHDILGSYFSTDQLSLIEAAFEMTTSYAPHLYSGPWETLYLSSTYFKAAPVAASARLRKIMENIIINNGEFLPSYNR